MWADEQEGSVVESFPVFYERHYSLLLGVAQRRLVGLSSAEDMVAEAFAIAWRRYHDGDELTLPWLYQVLRNLIGNEYRRLARSRDLVKRAGAVLDMNVVEFVSDEAIDVRRLLRELAVEEREIIYMAYWEDLSRTEIAAILGCSTTAVRLRLMRARNRFKELADDAEKDHERREATHG